MNSIEELLLPVDVPANIRYEYDGIGDAANRMKRRVVESIAERSRDEADLCTTYSDPEEHEPSGADLSKHPVLFIAQRRCHQCDQFLRGYEGRHQVSSVLDVTEGSSTALIAKIGDRDSDFDRAYESCLHSNIYDKLNPTEVYLISKLIDFDENETYFRIARANPVK